MHIDNINNVVNNSNECHPLKKSLKTGTRYYQDFKVIIEDILKHTEIFSNKEIETLLEEKLQLDGTFKIEKYYQGATELSVVYKIFKVSKEIKGKFEYEKCVNGTKKNIECLLFLDPYRINIEAKCPDLEDRGFNNQKKIVEEKNNITKNLEDRKSCNQKKKVVFMTAGRIPNREENDVRLKQLEENSQIEVVKVKNNDNKLKDFLQSAHNKFPDFRDENELNVLFVSLDDVNNIEQWWDYLHETEGLFTKKPFVEHNTFSRVDALIYTNLLYRHKNNEVIHGNAWDLDESFNLYMSNQFRQTCNKNHSKCKKRVNNFFLKYIKSLTSELCDFCKLCNCPSFLPSSHIISKFILKQEKDGKFYFSISNKQVRNKIRN